MALADPGSWARVFGSAPRLPDRPESLWGDPRDRSSNHPKCVLRWCFEGTGGWAIAPDPTHHHDNGFDYRLERWRRFPR